MPSKHRHSKLALKLWSYIEPFKIIHKGIRDGVVEHKKYMRGVVLDAGCGNMPYKSLLGASTYIGMDVTGKVDVRGSMLDIPLKPGSVDAILCTEVLEHMLDPAAALAEFHRVLRKGGYLLVTTPFMLGLHDAPHDYYRYTKYGLAHLIRGAGFKVISLKEHTSSFQMLCQNTNVPLYKAFLRLGKLRFVLGVPLLGLWVVFNSLGRFGGKKGGSDTLGYVCLAKKV
jgi:SAM-dependent methyltransferase